jgi:hypothetical protein
VTKTGDTRVVRITGKDEATIASVVVYLSPAEARELRDAAEDLLAHPDEPGWHVHISSTDYQTEVTLMPEVAE